MIMNGRTAQRAPAEAAAHGMELVTSDRQQQQVTVVSDANNLLNALTDMQRNNTQLLNASGNPITNELDVRDFIQFQLGQEGYKVTPMRNIMDADPAFMDFVIAAPERQDGSQDLEHGTVFSMSGGVPHALNDFQAEQVLDYYGALTVTRTLSGGVDNARGEHFEASFSAKPGEQVSAFDLAMNMEQYNVRFYGQSPAGVVNMEGEEIRPTSVPIESAATSTMLAISLLEQNGYAVQRFDAIFDADPKWMGYAIVAPKNEDGSMNMFSAELVQIYFAEGGLGRVADTSLRDEAISAYQSLQRQEQ
jgi:hypothetical protein